MELIELKGFLEIELIKPSGLVIPVYKGPNSIRSALKAYFRDKMDTGALNRAIDNLFTAGEVAAGGAQDGKDGIYIGTNDGASVTFYSTLTTSVAASNTHGKKWRGEIEFSADTAFTSAFLVHDWNGANETEYAFQDPTNVGVKTSDKMIFNWEVYLP